MKKLLVLILFCLIETIAYGQARIIRNDNMDNLRDLGSNLSVGANISGKQNGNQYVDPVTQTALAFKALTVTAGAYSTGYDIGGLQTVTTAVRPGANSLTIESVVISDKNTTAKNRTVIIFNANPSATTFTDNIALDIDDADLSKIACIIPLTSHQSFADDSVSTANNTGCAVDFGSGTALYATVIAAEAQTLTSTSDLTLSMTSYQD